jgi:hypothetical protein
VCFVIGTAGVVTGALQICKQGMGHDRHWS